MHFNLTLHFTHISCFHRTFPQAPRQPCTTDSQNKIWSEFCHTVSPKRRAAFNRSHDKNIGHVLSEVLTLPHRPTAVLLILKKEQIITKLVTISKNTNA